MLEVEATEWLPSWRIVVKPTSPKQIYRRIGGADESDALDEIEQLSLFKNGLNEAAPNEVEGYLQAPFCYPDPAGSRFGDGTFGIYYAAQTLQTAVEETRYHRERFLSATNEAAGEIRMQVLLSDVRGEFHTLVGRAHEFPELYHPFDYSHSQQFGKNLHESGSPGLTYHSVRHPGGFCIAVFEPHVLTHGRLERQLRYIWDGVKIRAVIATAHPCAPRI